MFNKNCSVLLVDDEAFSRMLIGDCIGRLPNIKLAASLPNGFNAKRYLLENPVDIVITDIQMPLMDGLELAAFVKEFSPQCAVIIISAFGEFEYAQRAIRFGVTDYLLKPVKLEQIEETIRKNREQIWEYRTQLFTRQYNPDEEIEKMISGLISLGSIPDDRRQKLKGVMGRRNILLRLKTKDRSDTQIKSNALFYKKALQSALPGWQVFRVRYEIGTYEYLAAVCNEENYRSPANIGEYLNLILEQPVELVLIGEINSPEKLIEYYGEMKQESKAEEIERALRYMETHLDEDLSRDEVADRVYLSPSYFSRLFKNEVGIGFSEHLLNMRMKHAKQLLSENRKVREVAAAVGFRDVKYFSVAFEKYTGYLPSEYRHAVLRGEIPEENNP